MRTKNAGAHVSGGGLSAPRLPEMQSPGSVNKTRAEDGNVPLSSATALAIGPHRKRDVVAGATAQRGSWPHAPEGLGLNLAISA